MLKKDKEVIVSDQFIDIYKNFNVYNQVERVRNLSSRERYLLIMLCLDKHDNDDNIFLNNIIPFLDNEVSEIYKVINNTKTKDKDLLDLIKETGYQYIETDNIIDSKGNTIREPLNKYEVRNEKIDLFLK
jgi:hypothetical protein